MSLIWNRLEPLRAFEVVPPVVPHRSCRTRLKLIQQHQELLSQAVHIERYKTADAIKFNLVAKMEERLPHPK
jgi:hypothetical protein